MLKKLVTLEIGLLLLVTPVTASADILTDLEQRIQSLRLQIRAIQSQAVEAVSTEAVLGSATVCPNLSRTLLPGMRGNDVKQLQQFLIAQNLLTPGKATGYFGNLTLAAVQRFQREQGIVSSGDPWTTGYGSVGPVTRAAIARVCNGESIVNQSCSFNGQSIADGASITAYQSSSVPQGQQCVSQTRTCERGTLSGTYQYASCSQAGAQAPSCTLSANPASVQQGGSSTLTLVSTNAASASIDQGIGAVAVNGTTNLTNITATKTYTATVTGVGGTAQCTTTVSVAAAGGAVAAPTGLRAQCNAAGNQVTLLWDASQNAANYGVRIIPSAGGDFYKVVDWYEGISYTVAVTPNTSYSWWVHANAQVGTLGPYTTGQTFSCENKTYPTMPAVAQTTLLAGDSRPDPAGFTPDIYSAELVPWNGAMRMYFGGWNELHPDQNGGDWNDDIYVADCAYSGGPCGNVRKVIDAKPQYGESINDPSIILHPGSQPYYIMYMTCSSLETNPTGQRPDLCYSTSWADDGIHWGPPTVLLRNVWLPSAVWKNGKVELYATDHGNADKLTKYDLGESGSVVGSQFVTSFDNPPSISKFYINVDVRWRPSLNAYQMLAERGGIDRSVIDYLDSSDGVNWRLVYPSVISAAPGEWRVGTPGQHPDSASWVYFGTTQRQDSAGFKINFAQWNPPN